MKKIIIILLCGAIGLAACSKKDNPVTPGNDTPPVTDTLLQGSWYLEMSIERYYVNDTLKYHDTNTYDAGDIVYTFSGDTLTLNTQGEPEQYGYSIVGDELLIRQGSQAYFFGLKWYSNDRMSLTHDETSVSASGEKRRSLDEQIFVRNP
ncbi:hypothetical protein [Taibaiella koreensis]|uniref:hypothetical protein n=1 Tax=Taibaiella koreensis TaxID=1268548 RepID=UPI000E59FB42|nr:hypothetical protein [Taibaiella koreensis]